MFYQLLNVLTQSDATLVKLWEQACQYMALDCAFKKLLPSALVTGCCAVCIRDEKLIVHANSGTIAARLRILMPDLLPQLIQQGYPINQSQIRVTPRPQPKIQSKQAKISQQGLANIESAMNMIHNRVVAQALKHLVCRHRA